MANPRKSPNGLSDEQAAREYQNGFSTIQIARRYNTNPKQISRMLKRFGCAIRTPEEARQLAHEMGRVSGPRPGRVIKPEQREKIGLGQMKRWAELPQNKRDELALQASNNLKNGDFGKNGASRLRQFSKSGSKIAQAIREALAKAYPGVVASPYLRLDERTVRPSCVVTVPNGRVVAVLVWGPSHFRPVFGDAKLAAQRIADQRSVETLEKGDYSVLTVEIDRASTSPTYVRLLCQKCLEMIPKTKTRKTVTVRI